MFEKVDETIIPAQSIEVQDLPVDFMDQSVKFKFKQLKDRIPGESWISMVYGPSKTGKTFFAGTAGPRSLFINIGDGLDTLMSPLFKSMHPASKDMITIDIREQNPLGIAEAFDMLTDVIDHALLNLPHLFDNIILDEATAFRKYAMNKATELNTSTRKGSRPARTEEYMKVDIQDYAEEMNMVEWFLGQYIPKFKGANKHFLMLAHERQIFSKPDKIGDEPVLKRVMPGFTGKTFPDKVPAFFDDVFHSEVVRDVSGNGTYRLRTVGNDSEIAGVRHNGVFKGLEVNPNFLSMLKRIQTTQTPIK
jgi:hypothetical protein